MKKTVLFSIITILSMSLLMGCGAKNADTVSTVKNDTVSVSNTENEKPKDVSSQIEALFTDFFGADKFSGYVYVAKVAKKSRHYFKRRFWKGRF